MSKLVRLEDVEAMINKLEEHCVVYEWPVFDDSVYCVGKHELLSSLSSLPTQNEWIPVSERLPEEDWKYYLCKNLDRCKVCMLILTDTNNAIWSCWDYVFDATHWMPLPPY